MNKMENIRSENVSWSQNNTKLLIYLYKIYRKDVGTLRIRNMKRMWEVIAEEFRKKNVEVSAGHCENRWRVLERNFKKIVDHNNKTGRDRKDFEFSEEMSEVLGKKKNICPQVLLSTETIAIPCENIETVLETEIPSISEVVVAQQACEAVETAALVTSVPKSRPKKKLRRDILEDIRNEKVEYYKEKLKLDKQKLEKYVELQQIKLEDNKQKLLLLEKRNKLLEEQNDLLKRFIFKA